MFEKILVPLDGSEHSTRALERAVQIAKKFKAELTLIHVYSVSTQPILLPEPTTMGTSPIPYLTADEISKVATIARNTGSRVLDDGEQAAKAGNVRVEKMLVEGHIVEEIVRVAREGNFDLIVIGARGLSRIREFLLGSVSDGVIHHATCPILLVK